MPKVHTLKPDGKVFKTINHFDLLEKIYDNDSRYKDICHFVSE